MALKPNTGNRMRVLYVIIGAAVIAGSFMMGLSGSHAVVVPVLGLMAMATGATGW